MKRWKEEINWCCFCREVKGIDSSVIQRKTNNKATNWSPLVNLPIDTSMDVSAAHIAYSFAAIV